MHTGSLIHKINIESSASLALAKYMETSKASPSMMEQEKPLKKVIFENAMKGQWGEVVKIYETKEESRRMVLTTSRDTALHLAVSGEKPKVVKEMVDILQEKALDILDILKLKNDKGNTPLHAAAALGDVYMCHCIASKDHCLISKRNNENETPLFVAAHFGHQEAFLCLHFLYKGYPLDSGRRKPNGDTFLHATLKGEFFSLAYQIIRKYPELANDVDENGFTPLHILATKPNAFQSGSRLGLFDRIIYRCLTVNEVKEIKNDPEAYLKRFQEPKEPWYPQNYGTCAQFFHMLFGVVFYGLPLEKIKLSKVTYFRADEENASNTNHEIRSSKVSHEENASNNHHHGKGIGSRDEEDDQENNLKKRYVPPNYATVIQSLKLFLNLFLIILGHGFKRLRKIIIKKERHTIALQVMNGLMEEVSLYKFNEGRTNSQSDINFDPRESEAAQGSSNKEVIVAPIECFMKDYNIIGSIDSKSSKYSVKMGFEKKVIQEQKKAETPFLIAAKMGITEIVESILEKFPVSIQDLDANGKNVLLLAVENRQTHTFRFLINRKTPLHESVFRQWDHQGNNALHLAAKYGEYRPWLIPGAALQMQWELKWYKFVKKSISKHLLVHYNNKNQTPKQIFTETHKSLVKDGSEWLTKTSESCSLVAALIATVAFATSATIPGGVKENSGKPVFSDEPAFAVFSISSLIALCFSVTALVYFLAILTSRFEEKDFAYRLPWKLIIGLTALFTSITAILVSFCAGHFFELRDKLKFAAFPIYVVTCLPVSFFVVAQLPLYFDLLRAIINDIPQRSNKEFTQ